MKFIEDIKKGREIIKLKRNLEKIQNNQKYSEKLFKDTRPIFTEVETLMNEKDDQEQYIYAAYIIMCLLAGFNSKNREQVINMLKELTFE